MWLRRLSHRWVDCHVVGMIFVWLKRLSFGWDDCHVAALTVIWLNDCHVVNTTVTWLRRLSRDWDDCRLFRETTFTLLSWDTSSGGHRCSKCLVLGQCNYCLLGITRLPKCCGIRNHPNLACIVFCDADSRPKLATVGGARAVPCRAARDVLGRRSSARLRSVSSQLRYCSPVQFGWIVTLSPSLAVSARSRRRPAAPDTHRTPTTTTTTTETIWTNWSERKTTSFEKARRRQAKKRQPRAAAARQPATARPGPVRSGSTVLPAGGLKLIRDEVSTWTPSVHNEFFLARW